MESLQAKLNNEENETLYWKNKYEKVENKNVENDDLKIYNQELQKYQLESKISELNVIVFFNYYLK